MNLYFLLLCLSQFVPSLSVGLLFSYVSPLIFVLSITILKEAYDDFQRYRSDGRINGRKYKCWNGCRFVNKKSEDLAPGDIVMVWENQAVTADCVLLWTSSP